MSSLLHKEDGDECKNSVEEQIGLTHTPLDTSSHTSSSSSLDGDGDSVSQHHASTASSAGPRLPACVSPIDDSLRSLGRLTSKYQRSVLAFWILLIPPLGLYCLPRILRGADSTFRPLEGTLSFDAEAKYEKAYPRSRGEGMQDPIVAVLTMASEEEEEGTLIDGTSDLFNSTRAFVYEYTAFLRHRYPDVSIESFYGVYPRYPALAEHVLASTDGRTSLVKISPPPTLRAKTQLLSFAHVVTSYADSTGTVPRGVVLSYTGLSLFQRDMTASSKTDLARLDTTSLPLSLLLLGYALGCSLPLLLLPVLTILSTISLWSVILYVLMSTTGIPVVQTAPSVMMSLTIAMSLDYSLFYLSRTLEETRQRQPQREIGIELELELDQEQTNVTENTDTDMTTPSTHLDRTVRLRHANQNALVTSGHSILVSGCTLSVCLLGLVVLPLDMMVSIGVGSSIAVLSCILVSLTMIPAVLSTRVGVWMVFHEGFLPTAAKDRIVDCFKRGFSWRWSVDRTTEEGGGVDPSPLLDTGESENEHRPVESTAPHPPPPLPPRDKHAESPWMRMGKYLITDHTRAKLILCLLMVVFIVPVSSFLFKLRSSIAIELMLPYGSPALATFGTLGDSFGRGVLSPYKIAFGGGTVGADGTAAPTVDSEEGFAFMHAAVTRLTTPPAPNAGRADGSDGASDAAPPYEHSFTHGERRAILAALSSRGGVRGSRNATAVDVEPARGRSWSGGGRGDSRSVGDGDAVRDVWNGLVRRRRRVVPDAYDNLVITLETVDALRDVFRGVVLGVLDTMERMEKELAAAHGVSKYDYPVLRRTLTRGFEDANALAESEGNLDGLGLYVDSNPIERPHGVGKAPTIQPRPSALSSFSGIPVLNGTLVPYSIYELSMLCDQIAHTYFSTQCPIQAMRTLAFLSNVTCNQNHTTTYITATLEVDPFSSAGTTWLTSARSILQTLVSSQNHTFDAYILDGAAVEYDAVTAVYASFPKMVALTTSIVFIFLGFSFRSVGATVRSVVSIAVTTSFVYGSAVLVYQYGVLNWMGIRGLSRVGEISFLPPLMAFTVVVGLGLDYDVFLTTRVLEYRTAGCTHTDSVLLGLEKTGRIITFAGVIMCVAFGGLLFSESIVLNQFSFFLVSAVLLDTFVVRTVLVPILLELCGEKWSWWPRLFPNNRMRSVVTSDS